MSSNHPGPPAQPNGPDSPDPSLASSGEGPTPSPPVGEPSPSRQAAPSPPPPPPPGPAPMAPRPQVPVAFRPPGPFKKGFGLGAGAGTGFGVALLVLGTVASLLIGAIFVVGAVASASAAGEPTTVVWGSPSARKTLRAVDVKGPILTDVDGGALLTASTYGYEVAKQIDQLDAGDADGLVLRMNTPGGTVTGSRAIADAVDRYKARTKKKVFAHVQGMSASGGMYAMAGADDIRADHGSSVGSIGILMGPLSRYRDVVALDGGLFGGGVTTTGGIEQFYLTQGRGKDAGMPYRELTEEERSVFMQNLSIEYAAFVDYVSAKRNIPADVIRNDLGAFVYNNVTAEQKGLIDGTMGVDEAYRHFANSAGIDPADTKVVAANMPSPLQTLLGAEARVRGQALPVKAAPGVRPVTAASVCGSATTVLAYHGNPQRDCG
jgi:protease IV